MFYVGGQYYAVWNVLVIYYNRVGYQKCRENIIKFYKEKIGIQELENSINLFYWFVQWKFCDSTNNQHIIVRDMYVKSKL